MINEQNNYFDTWKSNNTINKLEEKSIIINQNE